MYLLRVLGLTRRCVAGRVRAVREHPTGNWKRKIEQDASFWSCFDAIEARLGDYFEDNAAEMSAERADGLIGPQLAAPYQTFCGT